MIYSDEGRRVLLHILELTLYILELTPKWRERSLHPQGCARWHVNSVRIFVCIYFLISFSQAVCGKVIVIFNPSWTHNFQKYIKNNYQKNKKTKYKL